MSFTATYCIGSESRVIQSGTQPKKKTDWRVNLWLTNLDGIKTTHSAFVRKSDFKGIVPVVTDMLDNLLREEGDVAKSAGWQVCTH